MRVLLIGPNSRYLHSLFDFLMRTGYEPLRAYGGTSGITMIAAERPNVVIVHDHQHDMTGADVLTWLRDQPTLRHIPAILLGEEWSGANLADAVASNDHAELARALLPFVNSDMAARLSEFLAQ